MSEPIINHLNVRPIPGERNRYFVGSRSRNRIDHIVDLCYQEDENDTPHMGCSCEGFTIQQFTKGKPCWHIEAALAYRSQHGLEIPK